MTDSNSPSTSYKGSFDTPSHSSPNGHGDDEITFVNPCYAAPPPVVELQPFSSRQSRQCDYVDGREPSSWPTILEHDEKDVHRNIEGIPQGSGSEVEGERVMSKTKMFLTALGMCLTYFLGVSSFFPSSLTCSSSEQTMLIF